MPESCRKCSLKSTRLSSIDIIHSEMLTGNKVSNVEGINCIYGMDVYTNVKSNTRHEDCPLIDLDDEPCDDVVLPSESFAKTEMSDEMVFSFFESTISDFKDDPSLTRQQLFFYRNGIKITVKFEYE